MSSMRIAITGGIGSGKSTVSEYLRELGAYVIDADVCSREVVEPGEKGLELLVERYGDEILQSDGALNRAKLAGILFGSEEERKIINALLHPLVIERLLDTEREYRRKYSDVPVFFEIPLLFETGLQEGMDDVWLVTADDDLRVKRITQRSGCTKDEARARIKSQMPVDEQRAYKHTRLDNSSDKDELRAIVKKLYNELMEKGKMQWSRKGQ